MFADIEGHAEDKKGLGDAQRTARALFDFENSR